MEKNYNVLLYYCYTPIENPDQFRDEHHQLCLDLGLFGRIIIASEGLNGTVSGTPEACQKYMEVVKADSRFDKLEFKVEATEEPAFQKLYVRVKPEIVHSSLTHIDPNQRTGKHLEPEEWKEMMKRDDVVILDVRSNYEHEVGRFKNAVTLDIENFRDFPEKVEELKQQFKDKKVMTYCTGGIKCEKASAYLLEQGFEDVYQLHGGIIKYGIEAGGEDFEGKCYVFDGRIVADVNKVNPVVISKCYVCGTPSDRMVNCANPECNEHVAICEKCGWDLNGACSAECMTHPNIRKYDGSGYYAKNLNGYNPRLHSVRSGQ